jgi:hypothetical protein
MNSLSSVFFGTEGLHQILGVNVNFVKESPCILRFGCQRPSLSEYAYNLSQRIVCVVSQYYLHTLAHEMGHVLAYKLLTGYTPKIFIYTEDLGGSTTNFYTDKNGAHHQIERVSPVVDSIINISGPMLSIAFCTLKLIAAVALRSYLTLPVAALTGYIALVFIASEILYASISAYCRDNGDFGLIAKNGSSHLTLATVALVAEVAFGIFAATRFI